MHPRTTTAVVIGTLLAAVAAPAAMAAPPPVVDLRGAGVGTYVLDVEGSAHLVGDVTGAPFDGTYTATLASSDGSLPAPGVCEAATASVDVAGTKGRTLHLAATGEVCGTWADATYVVTHRFVGRYEVTDASARRLRGTDGWISVVLATEGRANIEAIDT